MAMPAQPLHARKHAKADTQRLRHARAESRPLRTHTHSHTHAFACMHAYTRAYTRAYIHAYVAHANINKHIHKNTDTQRLRHAHADPRSPTATSQPDFTCRFAPAGTTSEKSSLQ